MIKSSPLKQATSRSRHLVYAAVASDNLSELQRLSTQSFGSIEFVFAPGLVFATSRVDELYEAQNATTAQIADFSQVVNDLHRQTDILPFRYGAVLYPEQMMELAKRNGAFYRENFKRVEACSEVNAHWAVQASEIAKFNDGELSSKRMISPGGDYLRRKCRNGMLVRNMENAVSIVAVAMARKMGSLLRNANVSARKVNIQTSGNSQDGTRTIVSLNLLVQREAVSHTMVVLGSTTVESVLPVLVTGPWPAFSFLSEMSGDPNANELLQCKGVQTNVA